jgi:hypothetical protein
MASGITSMPMVFSPKALQWMAMRSTKTEREKKNKSRKTSALFEQNVRKFFSLLIKKTA